MKQVGGVGFLVGVLVSVLATGCAHTFTDVKVVETPVGKTQKLSEPDEPEFKLTLEKPTASAPQVLHGLLERTRSCDSTTVTEFKVQEEETERVNGLGEDVLGGALLGVLGGVYAFGEPEPGESEKEETGRKTVGLSLIGAGAIMMIHGGVVAALAGDKTVRPLENRKKEKDSGSVVCRSEPAAGVKLRLTQPALGFSTDYVLAETDHDGRFSFDPTVYSVFRYPVGDPHQMELHVRAEDSSLELPVRSWVWKPYKRAAHCGMVKTCNALHAALLEGGAQNSEVLAYTALEVHFLRERTRDFELAQVIADTYPKTELGKAAEGWLASYVEEHVKILESDIGASRGDRTWVDDWVESSKEIGAYGGDKVNMFTFGAVRNTDQEHQSSGGGRRADRELAENPVNLGPSPDLHELRVQAPEGPT